MISLLIMLGLIWIILKVLVSFVEFPFKFLGWLFKMPFSVFFWLVIILLFFMG